MSPNAFPSKLPLVAPQAQQAAFNEAAGIANTMKFRKYWDAELRASVYVNEFISKHPDWLSSLITPLTEKHELLQQQKADQLRQVIGKSDEREPRFVEIIDQHEAEGAIKYWLGMLMIDPSSTPAAYALVRVARRLGEIVVMCLKDHFREPRPSQVCPAIVPMVDPPITPAFPAGHALQSHLISRLIEAADRPFVQRDMLYALSGRIAENRVIAGLHYPLDLEGGVIAANLVFTMLTTPGTNQCDQFLALLAEAKAESQREREGGS
jgi:acid phosphatase (class A)